MELSSLKFRDESLLCRVCSSNNLSSTNSSYKTSEHSSYAEITVKFRALREQCMKTLISVVNATF